jgi:hypothetical protein
MPLYLLLSLLQTVHLPRQALLRSLINVSVGA